MLERYKTAWVLGQYESTVGGRHWVSCREPSLALFPFLLWLLGSSELNLHLELHGRGSYDQQSCRRFLIFLAGSNLSQGLSFRI